MDKDISHEKTFQREWSLCVCVCVCVCNKTNNEYTND
jgi:hypothetical protein